MLEAQESVSSATVVPTVEQLQFLWDALTQRVIHTNAPDSEIAKFSQVDADWLVASSKPMSLESRVQWARKMQDMSVFASGVEKQYPYKKSNLQVKPGGGTTHDLPGSTVTGALPWWYWPLRVGAGVGTGLLIYRTLRPAHTRIK